MFIPVALLAGYLLLPQQAFIQAQQAAAGMGEQDLHNLRTQDQITSGTLLLLKDAPLEEGMIDFNLLRKTKLNRTPPPVFDAALERYEGKQVKMRGFMTPYDSLTNFQTFMVFPTATGCNFCAPPSPIEVVLVRLEKKIQPYIPEPIEVEGTLSLWQKDKKDKAHKSFLFVLNDAKVKALSLEELAASK